MSRLPFLLLVSTFALCFFWSNAFPNVSFVWLPDVTRVMDYNQYHSTYSSIDRDFAGSYSYMNCLRDFLGVAEFIDLENSKIVPGENWLSKKIKDTWCTHFDRRGDLIRADDQQQQSLRQTSENFIAPRLPATNGPKALGFIVQALKNFPASETNQERLMHRSRIYSHFKVVLMRLEESEIRQLKTESNEALLADIRNELSLLDLPDFNKALNKVASA